MNTKFNSLVSAVLAGQLAGCSIFCKPAPIQTTPISAVITQVKRELGALHTDFVVESQHGDVCADTDGKIRVTAHPSKVVLDLKSVVTTSVGGSASASPPVGSVIVTPSISASLTHVATQEIILTLPVMAGTRADLQSEIARIQAYIKSRKAMVDDLKKAKETKSANQLTAEIALENAQLLADEKSLAGMEGAYANNLPTSPQLFDDILSGVDWGFDTKSVPPARLISFDTKAVKVTTESRMAVSTAPTAKNLGIAETFNAAISGMLGASHGKPCFAPQSLDLKLNFEAVRDINGGIGVAILVAKLGVNAEKKDDATQSITVTYDLSNGNASSAGGSAGQ